EREIVLAPRLDVVDMPRTDRDPARTGGTEERAERRRARAGDVEIDPSLAMIDNHIPDIWLHRAGSLERSDCRRVARHAEHPMNLGDRLSDSGDPLDVRPGSGLDDPVGPTREDLPQGIDVAEGISK